MSKPTQEAFEEPLEIICVDGEVVVIGPCHMHGAFTAKAAHQSAAILLRLAEQAARMVGEHED
jgi:hypothetical protein